MRKLMFVVFVAFAFVLLHSNITIAYENEIRSLSNAMADNIAKAGKKRIAVVDFTDLQGNITELGRFIAEEMSVDFTMTAKGFEVIDRNHLNRILAEHKLSISGIVDQKTVQKLGQIAGVDALVTGSITPLDRSIRVVCKVIATDTARVIGAAKGDIVKTKAIEELLERGIEGTSITSTSTQPKAQLKVELGDFIFEAKGCRREGQQVFCTVALTNNTKKTKRLLVYKTKGDSIAIDNLGNQYNAARMWFAGQTQGEYDGSIDRDVPPNLPMNIVYSYEDVVSGTKSLNVIIPFYYYDDFGRGKEFQAVLRNIPLSR